MKKLGKQYRLSIKFTVDAVENAIFLEKTCPFRKNQVESRYAASWGSEYEIVYLTALKRDALLVKKWWNSVEVEDLSSSLERISCIMSLPIRSTVHSKL
jgi:hypothetical protein